LEFGGTVNAVAPKKKTQKRLPWADKLRRPSPKKLLSLMICRKEKIKSIRVFL
jgi:hypothetical protein